MNEVADDSVVEMIAISRWARHRHQGAHPGDADDEGCDRQRSRRLREDLDQIAGKDGLRAPAFRLRPGPITTTASAKASLRAISRRWLALDAEIKAHEAQLETFTAQQAPELVQAHDMAVGMAAQMLILVGDNPQRIRSEAAFAKLCGAWPIPASSGKTNRHRLNRGGDRQANAALYRVVTERMRVVSRRRTT